MCASVRVSVSMGTVFMFVCAFGYLCVCLGIYMYIYVYLCMFVRACMCSCESACLCLKLVCVPRCVEEGWGPRQVVWDPASGSVWESPRGPRQEGDTKLDWAAVGQEPLDRKI